MNRRILVFVLALTVATPMSFAADDPDLRLFKAQQAMAAKGDPVAQYYLGEMYEHGLGTKTDLKQAFEEYEKAAAKGNPLAKYKLTHRKQIEEDVSRSAAAEKLHREQVAPREAEPPKPKPAVVAKPAVNPKAAAETPKAKSEKELEAEAAAREKLRAKLRAQLRERAKNPVGAPFE